MHHYENFSLILWLPIQNLSWISHLSGIHLTWKDQLKGQEILDLSRGHFKRLFIVVIKFEFLEFSKILWLEMLIGA